MTIGDLKRSIEGLSDGMELVVSYDGKALFVGGLGVSQMGTPAKFVGTELAVVSGPSVYEIYAHDHA